MRSLRIRFILGFTLLFSIFLGTALIVIYISYSDFRKDEFNSRLKDRALTTFKFLIEVEQIDNELLRIIDKNTMNSLYEEEVLIFREKELIYQSFSKHHISLNDRLRILDDPKKTYFTTEGDYEIVATHINQSGHSYTLIASAYDKYGRRKMSFLKWVILIVYSSGIALSFLATYLFVKGVIKPLDSLNKNIQNINSENLHLRLVESGQGKEVDLLAVSFNQMLKRLQQSFQFQKDFVHYASHELRTPLTAMIGVTETALSKQQLTNFEYREALSKLFRQQEELSNMTNSLLLLSDNRLEQKLYPQLRLDELVFRSAEIVRNFYTDANIQINIDGDVSDEDAFLVNGNEALLLVAFNNLLKNAIQYSRHNAVYVTIRVNNLEKEVEFKNVGEFLSEEEKEMLFTPFYRGSNSTNTKGHGLGLPLVYQIAKLHGASIKYLRKGEHNIFLFTSKSTAVAKMP